MARHAVNLTRKTTRKPNGRSYTYWVLRWFRTDGTQAGKTLGRVEEMSKRQAEKLRFAKELELAERPGRRDVSRAPELQQYLLHYLDARRSELARGSLELSEQTGRYLVGFFGASRGIDQVTRYDARAFKTALAKGDLQHVSRRSRNTPLAPTTVELHVRNARTIFNHAVVDDLILFNPFDRLADRQPVPRDWHYVDHDEFAKLMDATKSPAWKLLFALARWAALRRGEALNLPWNKIDWARSRLLVISRRDWEVKDKAPRVVPICPELHELLLAAFDQAPEGEPNVIPARSISVRNLWRDFGNLCKRAGVERYAKPVHTLRKSCITDWASRHPAHVVKQWAGHSDMDTTDRYYLQVSESEYETAAATPMTTKFAQLVAPPADYQPESGKKAQGVKPERTASKEVGEAPNETPLPNDVQLPHLGVMTGTRRLMHHGTYSTSTNRSSFSILSRPTSFLH